MKTGIVTAVLAALLAAPAVQAQSIGALSYVFHSSFPVDIPHVAWRMSSAFSAGLSDFLFQAAVIHRLPSDRVDPTLAAQANYGPTQYLDHLYSAVEQELLNQAQAVHAANNATDASATFEVLALTTGFTCNSPNCEVFELEKLSALMIPAKLSSTWSGSVETKAIQFFVSHLPQARIYSYIAGTGEQPIAKVPSLLHRRRFDVTCPAGQDCSGTRTK